MNHTKKRESAKFDILKINEEITGRFLGYDFNL